jgi:hypothetical protein
MHACRANQRQCACKVATHGRIIPQTYRESLIDSTRLTRTFQHSHIVRFWKRCNLCKPSRNRLNTRAFCGFVRGMDDLEGSALTRGVCRRFPAAFLIGGPYLIPWRDPAQPPDRHGHTEG